MPGNIALASSHLVRRVTLKRHIRALERHEGGGSQPQVFGAGDGSTWMVKAKNNPQGLRVLANELVGTALAARLGGSVRNFAVCALPAPVAETVHFSDGRQWDAGSAFGSELIDGGSPVIPDVLTHLANAEGLLAVVAADTWLGAHDSRQALAVPHPNGGYTVIAVDFGHTIGEPAWTAEVLTSRPVPGALVDGNGWASHRGRGMATRIAEAIDSITDEEIAVIIGQIPAEWGLSTRETDALRNYLAQRRPAVSSLVRQLESKETAT